MDGNDVVADLALNNHIIISGDSGTNKTDIAISVANQISNMFGNANKTAVVADASHVEEYNRRTYDVVGDASEAFGSVSLAWYPHEMVDVRSHYKFDELRPLIYILDNFNAVTDAFSRHDQHCYGSTWRLATAVKRAISRDAVEIAKIHTIVVGDIPEDSHRWYKDAHIRIRTLGDGTAECDYLDQDGNPVSMTMRVSPVELSSFPWDPNCHLIRETD